MNNEFENKVVTYMSGNEEIKLSPSIIRRYLVSGDANAVTEQEIVMFLNLCRFQNLNPFLKEAYLIKYGNQPATLVTGKSAFEKRAVRCSNYSGFRAGIIVLSNGKVEEREGTFFLQSEEIVGGWAEVYIKGFDVPIKSTVSMLEYIGRKKDGSVNGQWSTKPATMIRKVAKVQALREAFPEEFQGLYCEEEMNVKIPHEAEIAAKANTIDFNTAITRKELQKEIEPKQDVQLQSAPVPEQYRTLEEADF